MIHHLIVNASVKSIDGVDLVQDVLTLSQLPDQFRGVFARLKGTFKRLPNVPGGVKVHVVCTLIDANQRVVDSVSVSTDTDLSMFQSLYSNSVARLLQGTGRRRP